jgi:hypothetical protein
MNNKQVKNLLIYNFGASCWLGGKITKKNPLTNHHILAKRDGGETTLDNGALLSQEMHDRFNILEQRYPELAEEINSYLKQYKGVYPNKIQERIDYIMSLVKPHIKVKKRCR